LWAALEPHSTAGAYVNFLGEEGQERTRSAYRESYDRLAALKKTHDPENFFRLNQNIEPAAECASGRSYRASTTPHRFG
jgi:hypothetical protein